MADLSQPNNLYSNPDDHLARLLAPEMDEPWYKSFVRNVKELFNPPKLPPLELTSKPVPVQDIWGFYGGQEKKAGFTSIVIHGTIIAALLLIGTNQHVQKLVKENISLIAPDLAPYKPE